MRFYGFKPDFKLLKHVFGTYGMLHPSNTDNTMRARSTHGILLYSSDSTNGSVYCFNLETQGITLRRKWTVLPVTAGVIRLHE